MIAVITTLIYDEAGRDKKISKKQELARKCQMEFRFQMSSSSATKSIDFASRRAVTSGCFFPELVS